MTTAKVLGIQNQRLAQCRYAKITIHGPDTLPMQVDGEAWLQDPGIIVVSHKNKARIIFKNKVCGYSVCVCVCVKVFESNCNVRIMLECVSCIPNAPFSHALAPIHTFSHTPIH